MGARYREIKRTLKGVGSLSYVEVKNVPMRVYEEHGETVHSKVLGEIEQLTARELILRRLPIRGREVSFLRGMLAMSQREFAAKLGLSHVAILKWERAQGKRLDIINEIAVKTLMAGQLGLKVVASIKNLVGEEDAPKKLMLDFDQLQRKMA
jgi:DNA-binding transcriptional regulator YiaG